MSPPIITPTPSRRPLFGWHNTTIHSCLYWIRVIKPGRQYNAVMNQVIFTRMAKRLYDFRSRLAKPHYGHH